MNKYYAIKNENGRFMKVRTGSNGTKRAWVAELKGATVGTLLQCESMKNNLKKSPYYDGLEIVEIGESDSAWKAKFEATRNLESD